MNDRVLLVDDDANTLAAFARRLRAQFQVDTVQSGRQALLQVAEAGDAPYAVVVADRNMPGMNGADLLTKVRILSPDTIQIMLTGDSGEMTAADSEYQEPVFRLLMKPCSLAVLTATVAEGALQFHRSRADKTTH